MSLPAVALVAPPGVDVVAVADALACGAGVGARHLDTAVEQLAGRSVADVVLELGDDALRRYQAQAAAQLLGPVDGPIDGPIGAPAGLVVSVGSGAVEVDAVRAALSAWAASGGAVVLLDLPAHASARSAGLGAAGSGALGPVRAAWRELYERRHVLLVQVATIGVDAAGLSPAALADVVAARLGAG